MHCFCLITCSVFCYRIKTIFQMIIFKFLKMQRAYDSFLVFRSLDFVSRHSVCLLCSLVLNLTSNILFCFIFLFLAEVLKMRKRASDHSRMVIADNAKLKADLEAKRIELDTLVKESENKKRTSSNYRDQLEVKKSHIV